jgi:hypothetical protein
MEWSPKQTCVPVAQFCVDPDIPRSLNAEKLQLSGKDDHLDRSSEELEQVCRNLHLSCFLRVAESMRHPLPVYFVHLPVFAEDALHSVVVAAKHVADLLLGQESIAFDQVAGLIDISWVTRPSGPRQISKLSVPIREARWPVLDSPKCGDIHARDSLEFVEDCLVRSIHAPEEVNHSTDLERHSRALRPRSFSFIGRIVLFKVF